MDQVAELIGEYVAKRGKNKSQVAKQLGISSQLLGQYINGRQKPKADFYVKWKSVFGDDILSLIETNVSHGTPSGLDSIPLRDYVAKLERDKAFLEKIIDSSLLNIGASLAVIKEALLGDGAAEGEQKDAGSGDDANRAANTSKDKNVVVIRDKHPKKDKKSRV